ncbi:MAG: hypothetical protein IPG61_10785 [bacterium]|nr:hypothetical protein [bacterium]
MSTRRVLNLSLAAVGLLMLAAVGYVGLTRQQGGATAVQLEVAARQQVLIGALVVQADSLANGTGRDEVLAARMALGRTLVSFDQGLGALLAGGQVPFDDGHARRVAKVTDATARHALEQASQVWLETGMPLGDLAAGQYSAYSAAGQKALAGLHTNHTVLAQRLTEATDGIRRGAAQRATLAGYAVWAAAGLGVAGVVLLVVRKLPARRKRDNASTPGSAAHKGTRTGMGAGDEVAMPEYASANPLRAPRPGRAAPYAPVIDFDNVNAAVDQMSVDMNNIAGNTEKMRQAIDSVGFALQGMLYSLNEIAQDTAEGYKIVRNANNAASFTAEAATELVDSAREMSRIVGRVTQLATRTRQIASQIDGEAIHTGRTGEAFTSVVAQEVKGLAQQTNRATSEIDQTVNDVLATARQYEEAIGQIIKNVAAINKVSQNLGQLMLDPPRRVQAVAPAEPLPLPTPAVAPVAAAPAPQPAPAPAARIDDDPVAPEPTPREVAHATAEAIAAAAQPAPAPAAVPAPEPLAPPAAAAAPAAVPTPAADPVAAAPKVDNGSNGNVFMLGKPRRKPSVAEVLGTDAPAAPEAAPPLVKAPDLEVAAASTPTPAPAPAPAVAASPEPVAAPTPAGPATPQADGGSNRNVFLLNKPKAAKPATPSETAAPAAPDPTTAAAPAAPAAPAPAAPAAAEPAGVRRRRTGRLEHLHAQPAEEEGARRCRCGGAGAGDGSRTGR